MPKVLVHGSCARTRMHGTTHTHVCGMTAPAACKGAWQSCMLLEGCNHPTLQLLWGGSPALGNSAILPYREQVA